MSDIKWVELANTNEDYVCPNCSGRVKYVEYVEYVFRCYSCFAEFETNELHLELKGN